MLYLITGANGTGKTLFMLRWARDLQLEWQKKGVERTVYYNGMDMVPVVAEEFGWKFVDDPQKWMDLPDNSIVLVDECQKAFPTRGSSSKTPDYEEEIAISHRKRGFDFFFATQHPGNMSSFIRNLIGAPGWHRHIKRQFGLDGVLCFQFDYANTSCQKPVTDKSVQRSRYKFPREVYKWYTSAVMHTGKIQIHKAFYILAALLVFLGALSYYIYGRYQDRVQELEPQQQQEATQPQNMLQNGFKGPFSNNTKKDRLSTEDYLESFKPRLNGFPHTASRYDEVTKPITAPYPAACMKFENKGCRCFTQQGTRIMMDESTCENIVNEGFFIDWDKEPQRNNEREIS